MQTEIRFTKSYIMSLHGNKILSVLTTLAGLKIAIDVGWKTETLDKMNLTPAAAKYYAEYKAKLGAK